ncbi:hypothetical protein AWRI1631_154220 [Saccharomyces cerevisiae AWRI1631]|uniref:Uncharacterized protein n=1 Tax=Saccharomyces cerevisiae (strain AWRI1631) TaxID=545124 RepID=B5VSF4_YEAS6|nr:hypothetical protein AWRI1631_154220 [Saccharomyces cerevisiae AWRI1631]
MIEKRWTNRKRAREYNLIPDMYRIRVILKYEALCIPRPV